MTDYRIAVLLSAYNGERYIEKQIESILNQEGIGSLTLIVRNDGSKDATLALLKNFQKAHSNIEIIDGPNIGLVASFFELLKYAVGRGYDFYSFSDQDDYWLPMKLSVALRAIAGKDEPYMYASCSKLANDELIETGTITQIQHKEITFFNSAIQNICPGHNQVLNHKLAELVLKETKYSKDIYSQDLWITNVAAVAGKIVFDNTPHALYRQHTNNQLSFGKTRMDWVKVRIKRLKNSEGKKFSIQLRHFAECYEAYLTTEQKKEIKLYFEFQSAFVKRLIYIFRTKMYRQKNYETFLFKVLYLFGGYSI